MQMSRSGLVRTASLFVLSLGFVGSGIAFGDDKPATPPARDPTKQPPHRAPDGNAPRVPGEGVKGDDQAGGGGGKERPADRGGRMQPGAFLKAVHELTLSDTQKSTIDTIEKDWKKKDAEFKRGPDGKKIEEIEAKRREEIKGGGKPSEDTMKALQEAMSKAPKFDEYKVKITNALNDEQKKELETKLAAPRGRGADGAKRERPAGGAPGGAAGGDGKTPPPSRERPAPPARGGDAPPTKPQG